MTGQRVAITGASGLIGGALSSYLTARGDEVLHLVRRPARTAAEIPWDPARRALDPATLSDVTAVVHLAGAGIGDRRWTAARKHEILASRVDGTRTVAEALARLDRPVTLLSASGIDGYGSDRGEEVLTEDSSTGTGFLADVVRAWESATQPAQEVGCRVATLRTGIVLAPGGGALGRLLPLARLGLGGPLGSGSQWWSWITLRDEVRAIAHVLDHDTLRGPVNLVSPEPVRQRDLALALGRAVHRPAVLPAPSPALRVVLGQLAQTVLGSKRVEPRVLLESGFAFEHPTLEQALPWLLTRD